MHGARFFCRTRNRATLSEARSLPICCIVQAMRSRQPPNVVIADVPGAVNILFDSRPMNLKADSDSIAKTRSLAV